MRHFTERFGSWQLLQKPSGNTVWQCFENKNQLFFSVNHYQKSKRRCDIWYNSFYLLGNSRWGPETPPSNSKIWIFPDFFLKEEYGTIQNIDCDFAKIINIFIGCVRFPHRNNWCYIGSNLSKTSKFQSWVHFSLSWFRRYVYTLSNQLFV